MRRPVKTKRTWNPDPVYGSIAVTRFINNLMKDGKKSLAQKIFYKAMKVIEEKTKQEPFKIFQQALKNVAPRMEVWPRRVGGATYLVPREVRSERRFSLAVKWLIQAVRAKKGQPTYIKLAEELIKAANNEGDAIEKKNQVHKLAEANRAFAHFAWWGRKKKSSTN